MRAADVLLLTVVLAVLLAWPLASPPIGAHGEAREGLVVQDVVRHGRWVLPLRNGELPSKPPLFHWIAAVVVRLGLVSDAGVRMPSGLAAWGMAVATLAFGVLAGGRVVGWLAVGALLGTHGFWESASEARVDMVFAALVTLSLVAFAHWYRDGRASARAVVWLGAAGAVLAKGPAGAALPALVIVAFLLSVRRLDRLPALWSWRLAALALLLDLGWYALAIAEGGRAFVAVQLLHENVDRVVGRGVFGLHGGRDTLRMAGKLATDLLPWNLVLVVAAVRRLCGVREDDLGTLLHVWWLVILGVFTVAFGKRGVYLLPLYPAIAVLAARALAAALRAPDGALAGIPVPAAVRRQAPDRAALVWVAVLIAIVDVGLVLVSQTVREVRARRRSLAPFARAVGTLVPAGSRLAAAASVSDSDLQVLAYRLARALPRAVASPGALDCREDRYFLVGRDEAVELAGIDYRTLVTSDRRGPNLALVLAPPAAACAERSGT